MNRRRLETIARSSWASKRCFSVVAHSRPDDTSDIAVMPAKAGIQVPIPCRCRLGIHREPDRLLDLRFQVQMAVHLTARYITVMVVMPAIDLDRHQIQPPVAHAALGDHGVGEASHRRGRAAQDH